MVSEFGPSISRATSSPSSIRERERAVAILEEEGPEALAGPPAVRGGPARLRHPVRRGGPGRRAGSDGTEGRGRRGRWAPGAVDGSSEASRGMEFGQPLTAPAIEPPTM